MKKKLLFGLAFTIMSFMSFSTWSFEMISLIGHRGSSDAAPENTKESTLLAFKEGAAGAECDIQLTKDGEVILLHDDTLLRTTGLDKKPGDLNWKDIKNLDAGSWFGKDWSNVKIPLLSDILKEVLKNPGKIMVIELKENNPKLPLKVKEIIQKLDPKGKKLKKQIFFISFHHDLLNEMKKIEPEIPAFYLTTFKTPESPITNLEELNAMIEKAKANHIDGLDLEWASILNKEYGDMIKKANMKSLVWVYHEDDTLENIKQCQEAGIDYFTTNDPKKFLQSLK